MTTSVAKTMSTRNIQTIQFSTVDNESRTLILRALGYHHDAVQTACHQSGYSRLDISWVIKGEHVILTGARDDLKAFAAELEDECLGMPYGHAQYQSWLKKARALQEDA